MCRKLNIEEAPITFAVEQWMTLEDKLGLTAFLFAIFGLWNRPPRLKKWKKEFVGVIPGLRIGYS